MPTVPPLTVTSALVIESWPDGQLAALNNALAFGAVAVPSVNIAFRSAARLLREDGWPFDRETLLDALSFVITSRMDAGTWGKEERK